MTRLMRALQGSPSALAGAVAVAFGLQLPPIGRAHAQTVTISAGVKTLASPTLAVYNGTAAVPVVSVTGGFTCPNGNGFSVGCNLSLRVAAGAAGAQVIQARLVSVSGATTCARAATFASSTAWVTLTTTDVIVFASADKGHDCTSTIEFRTTSISWTAQTSNGATATNYDRDVIATASKN